MPRKYVLGSCVWKIYLTSTTPLEPSFRYFANLFLSCKLLCKLWRGFWHFWQQPRGTKLATKCQSRVSSCQPYIVEYICILHSRRNNHQSYGRGVASLFNFRVDSSQMFQDLNRGPAKRRLYAIVYVSPKYNQVPAAWASLSVERSLAVKSSALNELSTGELNPKPIGWAVS